MKETKELNEEDPLVEIMRSAIVNVIEEMDPPPDDEIIVTKNGIAMMNMEMFHKLTHGQYRNDVGMLGLKWTKDGPMREEEKK